MLSEAYSALRSNEDSLRSARLAVTLSHELVEGNQHSNNVRIFVVNSAALAILYSAQFNGVV
jgi:hypothetical protein